MEPLVVRPVEGWFEVVAGHRRLEACRLLNMRRVPCHIVSMDDKQAYETSLVENMQRQNLNALEEAVAFRRYVEEFGYGGISELARRIGKSQSYVIRRVFSAQPPRVCERRSHTPAHKPRCGTGTAQLQARGPVAWQGCPSREYSKHSPDFIVSFICREWRPRTDH